MWSGPSRVSMLEFTVFSDQPLSMRVHIPWHVQNDIATDLQLLVNGERLEPAFEGTDQGTTLVSAVLPACASTGTGSVAQPLRVVFIVATTRRPVDLSINEDRRWLGIAVNSVEFAPGSVHL